MMEKLSYIVLREKEQPLPLEFHWHVQRNKEELMNKKTISLLCSFILIFVSITLFGCKNEEEKACDESGYRIYYTQKDEHKLAVDYAGVEGDNMSELVGSFL